MNLFAQSYIIGADYSQEIEEYEKDIAGNINEEVPKYEEYQNSTVEVTFSENEYYFNEELPEFYEMPTIEFVFQRDRAAFEDIEILEVQTIQAELLPSFTEMTNRNAPAMPLSLNLNSLNYDIQQKLSEMAKELSVDVQSLRRHRYRGIPRYYCYSTRPYTCSCRL